MDTLPRMKTILRWYSKGMPKPDAGHFSADEIDAYVGAWLNKGYKLFNTHYIGENPEAVGVMFILEYAGASS